MNSLINKSICIVSELMLCCHKLGGTTSHIDVNLQSNTAYYKIRSPIAYVELEDLERVRYYLNQPRDRMMEENYWMLGGQSEDDGQLMLIGMMVDDAEVTFENGELCICVNRVGSAGGVSETQRI